MEMELDVFFVGFLGFDPMGWKSPWQATIWVNLFATCSKHPKQIQGFIFSEHGEKLNQKKGIEKTRHPCKIERIEAKNDEPKKTGNLFSKAFFFWISHSCKPSWLEDGPFYKMQFLLKMDPIPLLC